MITHTCLHVVHLHITGANSITACTKDWDLESAQAAMKDVEDALGQLPEDSAPAALRSRKHKLDKVLKGLRHLQQAGV